MVSAKYYKDMKQYFEDVQTQITEVQIKLPYDYRHDALGDLLDKESKTAQAIVSEIDKLLDEMHND